MNKIEKWNYMKNNHREVLCEECNLDNVSVKILKNEKDVEKYFRSIKDKYNKIWYKRIIHTHLVYKHGYTYKYICGYGGVGKNIFCERDKNKCVMKFKKPMPGCSYLEIMSPIEQYKRKWNIK